MAALVGVFVLVLFRRLDRVVTAEKAFSDSHSRATGVVADTIANLTTVRAQAAEDREKVHVDRLVGDSMRRRPAGPPRLHDHPDPDGVGHGLLQLGLPWPWASCWRCITSLRPGSCT